jgi:hypothetical protein
LEYTDVSEVPTASIISDILEVRTAYIITLMMEAVRMPERSIFSETTRRYVPEGSHLHTRHRGNLKSHNLFIYFCIYLFVIYLTMPSVAQRVVIGWLVDGEFERIWKEAIAPSLKVLSRICLAGLRKATKVSE